MVKPFVLVLAGIASLMFSNFLLAGWFEREASIMGTRIYVELWHEDSNQANQVIDQVMAEMKRIDQLMSPYIPTSELAIINQQAAKKPVIVGKELFDLIKEAKRYGDVSQGAFDITFASVGHQYQYRDKQKPTENSRKKAAGLIDYQGVMLNEKTRSIFFRKPGMLIDLGGIAKGYVVDNGITILQKSGVSHGIVTAGGDSRLLGDRRGRPWVLGIRHPRGKDTVISLPLENVSISTSGDYERFFEEDGVRYHHIIDPKKGDSARDVLSATILADQSMMADALSTTVFVLGIKKGLNLVNAMEGVSAIIIDKQGKVFYSNDLTDPED